jgi:hypothetical protein
VRDEQGAGAVDPQTILFYCWSPDVEQLHAELTAAGLRSGRSSIRSTCSPASSRSSIRTGTRSVVGQLDAV